MARYETAVRCPGDPEKTFSYLAAFQNAQEWDPGVARARRTDEGPLGVGSTFEVTTSFLGNETSLTYEITRFEAPFRVVLEASTPILHSHDEIRVQPLEDGCRVTYDARLTLRGPLALGDPLLALTFAWIGDRAAEGLRDALGGIDDR